MTNPTSGGIMFLELSFAYKISLSIGNVVDIFVYENIIRTLPLLMHSNGEDYGPYSHAEYIERSSETFSLKQQSTDMSPQIFLDTVI